MSSKLAFAALLLSFVVKSVGAQFPEATPAPTPTIRARQADDCFAFEDGYICGSVFSSATVAPSRSIPAAPTGLGVCSLHIDHYHCEGDTAATGAEASASYSMARGPEPTGRGECIAHLDHWDCALSETGDEETISDTGGEGCIQHGTHFHCPAGVTAGCDPMILGDYDLPLHIGALFVLLIASAIGVFTPVLFSGGTAGWVRRGFFCLKHFGTGIIISTAFIHLLLHAFVMFANECLGELAYEAISPAIVMAAVMMVFLLDFFAARWMASRRLSEAAKLSPAEKPLQGSDEGHSGHVDNGLGDFGHTHGGGAIAVYDGASKQAHWDVQVLEAGIVFHSIMIGVTLGAQAGSGFIPTFIAIVFHQLFEGLGIGARIATLLYPNGGSWKKWAMCIAYTLVTPVGIAIGIAVHEFYNLNGKASLLVIGILDSISAGILLYAGIGQLLMMEWVNGEMRDASLGKIIVALFSLFLGLLAMSVIGKWA